VCNDAEKAVTKRFSSILAVIPLVLCTGLATPAGRMEQAPTAPAPKSLQVYWIDVEGGAATLIVTPASESVLIDTGYPGGRDAARIHKVATEVAGLSRIDHLVVTHFHIDHFGGAAELSKRIPIGRVYDNGAPSPPPNEKDAPFFAEYTRFANGRRTLLNPGDVIPLAQTPGTALVNLSLLGTRQQFVRPREGAALNAKECRRASPKANDTTDNANSTVWLLELGPFRFFDAGDLTWNTEARVVCPVNLVGQVDVYQVTHHGLDVSNNPVLVRSLAPTVSVMNNGTTKGTGPETVATLKRIRSLRAMYQIHKNLREDSQNNAPDEYIANLVQQCAGQHIRLTVEPVGKQYTVEIPAKGHRATYATRRR
jgi:competence protein ComEC